MLFRSADYHLRLDSWASAEAQVAALADDIAYNNHDVDDGVQAGLFNLEELRAVPLIGPHVASAVADYPSVDIGILRLEAVRHGPPSERSLDVSVVLDLMIHDLDLALSLTKGEPLTVEAQGVIDFSGGWDQAAAEVTFDNGFICRFDASRMEIGRAHV